MAQLTATEAYERFHHRPSRAWRRVANFVGWLILVAVVIAVLAASQHSGGQPNNNNDCPYTQAFGPSC